MNLILCDKCGNRNIMCFNCEQNKHYRESNRSHDEYIKRKSIKEFANMIVERLEEKRNSYRDDGSVMDFRIRAAYNNAIEIVKEELSKTDI